MNVIEKQSNDYLPDLNRFRIIVEGNGGKTRILKFTEILPDALCPYLVHSLIPYIKTFSEGGAFPWMRTVAPNSVDVQCPNPSGSVVVRLANDGGVFRAKVLQVRGACPMKYKQGGEIAPLNRTGVSFDDFNLLLEWLILLNGVPDATRTPAIHSATGAEIYRIEKEGETKLFSPNACPPRRSFKLKLGCFTHRCRYHKWPRRESYDETSWIPDGLCPELFHAAYPLCLASIYGGCSGDGSIGCPNGAKVGISVRVEKRPLAFLRDAAMRGLQLIGKNIEIPLVRCFLQVKSADADCSWAMKRGAVFEFNMGELNQICPATFHNSYPVFAARFRGASFPWSALPESGGVVQCPDSVSNITMVYQDER